MEILLAVPAVPCQHHVIVKQLIATERTQQHNTPLKSCCKLYNQITAGSIGGLWLRDRSENESLKRAPTALLRSDLSVWHKKEEKKVEGVTVEPIPGNDGYVMDIDGQKAVAVKLPGNTIRQITGQAGAGPATGIEVAGSYAAGTEPKWLVFTNMQNPRIEEYNNFILLASRGLENVSGSPVSQSSIVLTASGAIRPQNQ